MTSTRRSSRRSPSAARSSACWPHTGVSARTRVSRPPTRTWFGASPPARRPPWVPRARSPPTGCAAAWRPPSRSAGDGRASCTTRRSRAWPGSPWRSGRRAAPTGAPMWTPHSMRRSSRCARRSPGCGRSSRRYGRRRSTSWARRRRSRAWPSACPRTVRVWSWTSTWPSIAAGFPPGSIPTSRWPSIASSRRRPPTPPSARAPGRCTPRSTRARRRSPWSCTTTGRGSIPVRTRRASACWGCASASRWPAARSASSPPRVRAPSCGRPCPRATWPERRFPGFLRSAPRESGGWPGDPGRLASRPMTGSLGAGAASSYPAEYDVDVTLRDGSTAAVRPIRPEDEPALARFLATLSEQARWFHFFSAAVDLRAAARVAVDVDHRDRFGLVAFAGGRLVGHAQYGRLGTRPEAEVAFAVSDAVQGQGLATILLAHLAERASACGIHVLEAVVLRANHRMVEVFRDSGFPVRTRTEGDELVIELPASLSPQARSAFEQREGTAAVAAVRHVLEPASIVVVGASRHPGKVGRALVDNLGAAGFPGELWAVNPTATAIGGVPCFPTVDDLPGEPELAVVALPAELVVATAERCAAHGVKALVVVSAGFAEVGPEGARRQAELVAVCRRSGMRLVGPNCIGVANTDAAWPLDATFAPDLPPAGSVALMAQSGAVALTVIEAASERGIGLASFVSAGNKADLSSNDFLRYWEQDDATRVVLLYLESFGNPRRFGRIAPRVARTKPVVAVKAGRSAAGAAASASHTGALVRASDVTVDALFRRAGVIRCDTLAEQLDVAGLLALAPEPRGRRVAVVTNAGGPAIMAADACAAHGLEVPALPPGLQRHLRSFLPAHAAVGNPVDLIATATPDQYAAAIEAVAAADAADAIVAVFVRPLGSQSEPVLQALERAAAGAARSLPVLAVMMSDHARLQARPK